MDGPASEGGASARGSAFLEVPPPAGACSCLALARPLLLLRSLLSRGTMAGRKRLHRSEAHRCSSIGNDIYERVSETNLTDVHP